MTSNLVLGGHLSRCLGHPVGWVTAQPVGVPGLRPGCASDCSSLQPPGRVVMAQGLDFPPAPGDIRWNPRLPVLAWSSPSWGGHLRSESDSHLFLSFKYIHFKSK